MNWIPRYSNSSGIQFFVHYPCRCRNLSNCNVLIHNCFHQYSFFLHFNFISGKGPPLKMKSTKTISYQNYLRIGVVQLNQEPSTPPILFLGSIITRYVVFDRRLGKSANASSLQLCELIAERKCSSLVFCKYSKLNIKIKEKGTYVITNLSSSGKILSLKV